jgi:hypothetical protein
MLVHWLGELVLAAAYAFPYASVGALFLAIMGAHFGSKLVAISGAIAGFILGAGLDLYVGKNPESLPSRRWLRWGLPAVLICVVIVGAFMTR